MAEKYRIKVQDKFGDTLDGYIGEFKPGTPQIEAKFTPTGCKFGSNGTPRELRSALERAYATKDFTTIRDDLESSSFVVISEHIKQ